MYTKQPKVASLVFLSREINIFAGSAAAEEVRINLFFVLSALLPTTGSDQMSNPEVPAYAASWRDAHWQSVDVHLYPSDAQPGDVPLPLQAAALGSTVLLNMVLTQRGSASEAPVEVRLDNVGENRFQVGLSARPLLLSNLQYVLLPSDLPSTTRWEGASCGPCLGVKVLKILS